MTTTPTPTHYRIPCPAWEEDIDDDGNSVWSAPSPYTTGDTGLHEIKFRLCQSIHDNQIIWLEASDWVGEFHMPHPTGYKDAPRSWDSLEEAKAELARDYAEIISGEAVPRAEPSGNTILTLAHLEPWLALFLRLQHTTDRLRSLFRADLECEVITLLNDLFHGTTLATAAAIDDILDTDEENDTLGWLEWFLWENDGGKKGMEASIIGQTCPVRTLRDLAELLEA